MILLRPYKTRMLFILLLFRYLELRTPKKDRLFFLPKLVPHSKSLVTQGQPSIVAGWTTSQMMSVTKYAKQQCHFYWAPGYRWWIWLHMEAFWPSSCLDIPQGRNPQSVERYVHPHVGCSNISRHERIKEWFAVIGSEFSTVNRTCWIAFAGQFSERGFPSHADRSFRFSVQHPVYLDFLWPRWLQ